MPTLSRILHWKRQQWNLRRKKGANKIDHEYSWIRSLLQHFVWWQFQKGIILKGGNMVAIIRLALHRTPVQVYSTKHEIYLSTESWTCHLKLNCSMNYSSLHWHIITSLPITLHITCNFLALRINITSKSAEHDALNSYMCLYRNMSISNIKHKSQKSN